MSNTFIIDGKHRGRFVNIVFNVFLEKNEINCNGNASVLTMDTPLRCLLLLLLSPTKSIYKPHLVKHLDMKQTHLVQRLGK